MKKLPPTTKLSFSPETIRRLADTLTDDQLRDVQGGLMAVAGTEKSKTRCDCGGG